MRYPWTTRPDTTSKYQVGGIGWNWRSGWLDFVGGGEEKQRAVTVYYTPLGTAAEMHMHVYADKSATPRIWVGANPMTSTNGIGLLPDDPTTDLAIDTTKASGTVVQRMPSFREHYTEGNRYISVELGGVSNADILNVLGLTLDEIEQ